MNSKIRQRTKWFYPTKTNGKNNRIYNIWNGMQQRCFNKNNAEYEKYSKTSICEEWKNYDKFYEWSMNNNYDENMVLNRKDKNIGYFPLNCEWVKKEQQTYSKIKKTKWNSAVSEKGKCTRIYLIWKTMVSRTTNPKCKDYSHYSKLGICDDWLDYDIFYNWAMKHNYNDELTIDRIDNTKGYSPDNCQFIPLKENARKQNSRILIEGKSLLELSEKYGINKHTLYDRYRRGKKTLKEVLEE